MWTVYIILKNRCYYTGITTNLPHRLAQHGDVKLLYREEFPDKYTAAAMERTIKGFSRKKKETLIARFSR